MAGLAVARQAAPAADPARSAGGDHDRQPGDEFLPGKLDQVGCSHDE